jgi:hypothetical protein
MSIKIKDSKESTFKTILEALPALTLPTSKEKTESNDSLEHYLYETIKKHALNIAIPNYSIVIKSEVGKDLKEVTLLIKNFEIDTTKKSSRPITILDKPQRLQALCNLYVTLILEYLTENKIPIYLPSILRTRYVFIGLVNNSFPGYIDSGLISFIYATYKV